MKILNVFAAACLAVGLFFSSGANAAEIYYYSDNVSIQQSTYSPAETLVASRLRANTEYQFAFDESGILAPNTRLVYTLTASVDHNKLSEDSYLNMEGYVGDTDVWTTLDRDSDLSSPLTFGGLPVLLMASFDDATSNLITKISLTNNTGDAQDFDAYISGFFSSLQDTVFEGLKLTVTAETSAVPLPGALLMFASGMAFLGGVAKRKRTKI